jgi:hypothetical protein
MVRARGQCENAAVPQYRIIEGAEMMRVTMQA